MSGVPEKLIVSREGAVTRITFNAPERRNAIDTDTAARFRDAVFEAAEDQSRVLILTGAGNAFSSGADLKSAATVSDVTEYLRTVTNPTILKLREMPKPVIARMAGVAAGIGCNIALAADIRIASEDARLGQAFVKIGLVPDGGSTYFLPRLIGYARAFEWITSGELMSAGDAHALGLLNRVVPRAELDTAVDAVAANLASSPALAIAAIKQALFTGERGNLAEALDTEAVLQRHCLASEDHREGVRAFVEKRKPVFQGR